MPKEAEGGGDKESKEERAQDAPEQTVRKRVRANTPSPHRGNTLQGETQGQKNRDDSVSIDRRQQHFLRYHVQRGRNTV